MSSVIFNSYLIGIVAGKISEESVGAGFKHAAILVLISIIAAKVNSTIRKTRIRSDEVREIITEVYGKIRGQLAQLSQLS